MALTIAAYTAVGARYKSTPQNSSIVGTWVSEKDRRWKLVFTADLKCKQYYENELNETDSYVISNTSPQCGETVPIEEHTSYLQLTNLADGDKICYEINGISPAILSLRVVDRGGAMVFKRQRNSKNQEKTKRY